jgi:predicted RNA-binding Zn ribbon-like protein
MPTPSRTSVFISGHVHVADLEACLDFMNTLAFTDGQPEERLRSVDDVISFLGERGLAHEDAITAQAAVDGVGWLHRVRASREAFREVWDAQVERRIPDQGALDVVNRILREAPRIELVAGDDCCGVGHRHTVDDPTGEALASLAQPLVESIADGETSRFRICANDGCRWVFEDTSRGGRRRWCDMSSCGNRAKAQRYRTRHRPAAVDQSDDTAAAAPAGASAHRMMREGT